LFGFTAAQLAQKILFRFERAADELPLMAMITNLVRTAMTAIAIDESRVCIARAAEPEENPNRQQKPQTNSKKPLYVIRTNSVKKFDVQQILSPPQIP
jgi:hypothetical protein